MKPKEILKKWIDCFNTADVTGLAALYADGAVNHQVANAPVVGKKAIHIRFDGIGGKSIDEIKHSYKP